jgi:hypothetical protein
MPSGDQALQAMSIGAGLSSSLKPEPSGLSVAGRSGAWALGRVTRTLLPSGDQNGLSASPGRSRLSCVPSGSAVKTWWPSIARSNLPNAICPFGPGYSAWASPVPTSRLSRADPKNVNAIPNNLVKCLKSQ